MASGWHRSVPAFLPVACAALGAGSAAAADTLCANTARHAATDARVLRAIDEAGRVARSAAARDAADSGKREDVAVREALLRAAIEAAYAYRACDVATGGDAKLETIGGNVVQSVTLSRMTLNARKVLGEAYIGQAPRAVAPCPPGAPSCRGSLSRRPWSVLLQFRQ